MDVGRWFLSHDDERPTGFPVGRSLLLEVLSVAAVFEYGHAPAREAQKGLHRPGGQASAGGASPAG